MQIVNFVQNVVREYRLLKTPFITEGFFSNKTTDKINSILLVLTIKSVTINLFGGKLWLIKKLNLIIHI